MLKFTIAGPAIALRSAAGWRKLRIDASGEAAQREYTDADYFR